MSESSLHASHFMSISDAMRVFGLSARAFRFYEERGLISARRNRVNARLFDAMTRRRLAWIVNLRSAGVSLHDIHLVLNAEDRRSCALRKLEECRLRAEEGLNRINDAIGNLDTLEGLTPPKRFAWGDPQAGSNPF